MRQTEYNFKIKFKSCTKLYIVLYFSYFFFLSICSFSWYTCGFLIQLTCLNYFMNLYKALIVSPFTNKSIYMIYNLPKFKRQLTFNEKPKFVKTGTFFNIETHRHFFRSKFQKHTNNNSKNRGFETNEFFFKFFLFLETF